MQSPSRRTQKKSGSPDTHLPIAVSQQEFGGALDISFAGGADAGNVRALVQCGLAPVTVCSDLLRPGGYQRLHQYLDNLEGASQPDPATALANWLRRCG